MAGAGSRFVKQGIKSPKQLLTVRGRHVLDISLESMLGWQNDYGNLIIHLIIEFPESLVDKLKEYLKIILIHSERDKEKYGSLVQAFYYKNKEDIVKEIINEKEDTGLGCIQQ